MTHRFCATKDGDLEKAEADADAMRVSSSRRSPTKFRTTVCFRRRRITAEIIKAATSTHGIRLLLQAAFGRQQERVQIDLRIRRRILLPRTCSTIRPARDTPGAPLRIYSKESVIAEKFEAIASLGELNSRYKDFDDIVQLADRHSFYASALWLAMNLTSEHVARRWNISRGDRAHVCYPRPRAALEGVLSPPACDDCASHVCLVLTRSAVRRRPLPLDRDGHDRIWSHDGGISRNERGLVAGGDDYLSDGLTKLTRRIRRSRQLRC